MVEEIKKEEVKEENVEKDKSLLDEIKEATKELKEANAEKEKLLKKEKDNLDRREIERNLGGSSSAGSKPEKKEETPKEYAERVLRGEVKK